MCDIEWDDDSVEITSRPLLFSDVAELNARLEKAYAYVETCPKEVQEFLRPVIDVAADFNCELMYQLGFEDPNEIDFLDYKITLFKDE